MRFILAVITMPFLACAALAAAAEEHVTVTFEAAVPDSTPARSRICLAGDAAALGAWNENGVVLIKQPDGTYTAQVKLSRDIAVEYKLTRGTWHTVEKNPDGSELANRTFTPTRDETINLTVAAWADQVALAPAKSTKTGDIRLHEKFHSKHLDNDRTILVWLPPEYENAPEARYPVLYMHDGQNLFDTATSFAGEWQADETTGRLIESKKIRPIIIVGMANNSSRMDEYTLTRDERRAGGGNGAKYLKFVAEEVKPFIDNTYRTNRDRANTAVGGSSLGGTISLELCRAYPEMFGNCAAISPAAWWNNGELLNRFEQDTGWMKDTRFWIDTGTAEGQPAQHPAYVDAVHRLEATLKKAGLTAERNYAVRIVEGGLHNEQAWAKRFDQVLMFLFPP